MKNRVRFAAEMGRGNTSVSVHLDGDCQPRVKFSDASGCYSVFAHGEGSSFAHIYLTEQGAADLHKALGEAIVYRQEAESNAA